MHDNYDASSIQVLEGLEAVRRRPAMYIGSTDTNGLHHLVFEVVDNSIDEAMAGYCTAIEVSLYSGGVRIIDNGRGIPVDFRGDKSALEIVTTVLHSGGKFDHDSYKFSGGLHGVGISVVNALSSEMQVEVRRNGKRYVQSYNRGVPISNVKNVGETEDTGTSVWFIPDAAIFEDIRFDYDLLATRLREMAYLNAGVRISISDDRTGMSDVFDYDGGVSSFVKYLNASRESMYDDPIHIIREGSDVAIDIAIQHNTSYGEHVLSFVNNINTKEGGTHLSGFRAAWTRAVNSAAISNKLVKDDVKFTGEDLKEGMTAVVSVKVRDPQFEGQTKLKLGNSDARGLVEGVCYDALVEYFEEHPDVISVIVKRAADAMKAREAARRAKDTARRKNALSSGGLPGKLADCSETNPSKCELFLTEGLSAGGSAKTGRNRHFQAILPLRGKVLNAERARIDKLLKNEEIRNIIVAIGAGVGDDFDVNRVRYHKICLFADADVDGSHIRTLLLTFFFRYMRPLIDAGYVYLACPPLYQVRKGKDVRYVHSDDERDAAVRDMGGKPSIQRYKGLGEMNPEQLWETTMDPEKRTLIQVTIGDAEKADRIFSVLMGDRVDVRREFIEMHARNVKNLDV